MKGCFDCGRLLTFSEDIKSASGKCIPLDAEDLKPHDCPIKKLKYILAKLNEETHAQKMTKEAVMIAMENVKKYGLGI